MKASWSGLPHLEAAGEGETGAERPAGDLAREDGGGAGDRPRPGLRPLTRWRRHVSVMALSSAPSSLLSSCCSRVWSLPTAKDRRACSSSKVVTLSRTKPSLLLSMESGGGAEAGLPGLAVQFLLLGLGDRAPPASRAAPRTATLARASRRPYDGVSPSCSRVGGEKDCSSSGSHLSGSWRAEPANKSGSGGERDERRARQPWQMSSRSR